MRRGMDGRVMQVYGTFDSPADLDDDYGAAVVRLAWAVDRKSGDRPLLCAGVDLLPHEVPPPVLLGERSETVSRRFFLYTHEVQGRGRDGPSPRRVRAAPRTDPSVQNYRTGLLPRVVTSKRRSGQGCRIRG